MAKEADLKRIELKVSVNCCDGCKRKVTKILRSVEGVLKTEIDPSQPKVTVLGIVDPQILVKKLLKAGKQAELRSQGDQSAGKAKKEADTVVTKNKDQSKSECEQAKSSESVGKENDKMKEAKNSWNGDENKASKKDQKELAGRNANFSNTEVDKSENPISPHLEMNSYNLRTCSQYCYKVEPCAVALPYYAIPSYSVFPQPPTCYGQEYLQHEGIDFQPPFQTPVVRAGDYFSDENTMGCHVM